MNLAQRVAVAVTLLAIAAFLFWTVQSLPAYAAREVRAWAGVGGFLAVGGAAVVLLGIKRKRAKE